MLSGWKTKGYYACPYCHVETGSIYLPYSRKCVYLKHRRFLPLDHPWREDKKMFDGKTEHAIAPQPLTGEEIERLFDDTTHTSTESAPFSIGWNKKSVFYELPYWSSLLIQHNLDVMHIEKNICENIISWLLYKDGRSKENINSRLDMQHLKIRKSLWPKEKKNSKWSFLMHCII